MNAKSVTITALLFAVPVVVVWGILPIIRGARREHQLRSPDPQVVAATIEAMLRSGTGFERAALDRFDADNDRCALDLDRRVGVLAHGDAYTEIFVAPAREGAAAPRALDFAVIGVHRVPDDGDAASFVIKAAGEASFRRHRMTFAETGAVDGRELRLVTDDELAVWRRDPDWPVGW